MKKANGKTFLTIQVVLVMVFLLTACGSSLAASNQEKVTELATAPETKMIEEAAEEVAESEIRETEEEVVREKEEEPIETDPYTEIDMGSTLPGVEWIQTFNGIIDEPKLVVFNDSTNKKIILEDLQEVEFEEDDTLAVYIPEGRGKIVDDYYFCFDEVNYYDSVVTMQKIPKTIKRDRYSSAVFVDLEFDGKPKSLYVYLKYMN